MTAEGETLDMMVLVNFLKKRLDDFCRRTLGVSLNDWIQ